MLFTGKGDKGDTGLFGSSKRISKSSALAEALGALDEVNSFLGLPKLKSKENNFRVGRNSPYFSDIVHSIQQTLFIIQAELAGTPKTLDEKKVRDLEAIIKAAEEELPPIHSFFISGGTELAALFDVSRTLARRAERRVVAAKEEGARALGEWTLAYLNRLSSALYALARLSNHKSGIKEEPPNYN